MSYPHKDKKTKKLIRKEIPIARIDVSDKEFMDKLKQQGIVFTQTTIIFVVIEGQLHKWDANFIYREQLYFFMQRLANPVVSLSTEEEVMEFLDTKPEIWKGDHTGTLVVKDKEFENGQTDEYVQQIGYNTRVVAFWYGKDEWREEVTALKQAAIKNAPRLNLRVGQVTDKTLITRMKKAHPEMFATMSGLNVMVLRRYDSELVLTDLNVVPAGNYKWWMNAKSSKPIDELNRAAFQFSELTGLPVVIAFVNFKSNDERVVRES